MKKPLLFAFDFDHTIVQKNTDLVARSLIPEKIIIQEKKLCWTDYMKNIFVLLHKNNIQKDKIINSIQEIPGVNGIKDLLINLHSNNCEIIIISDSNSVFIDSWLKAHNLDNIVDKIFTNPAWFDEEGLLNISPYQHQTWCHLDSENLCKGYVLEKYIKQRQSEDVTFDKIAYAGDGKNDYCPMMKLSLDDMAFPRLGYHIMKVLNDADDEKKPVAKISTWNDANDIWNIIKKQYNF
ncbi:pyridoxal phosphate phosphatase PHOSPHO2-like isoform X2 [Aphidius gifuensis]|uniref:pyridoxal phosphate phosphatase PHOSPHO2-like isoform X2 n=1 Tax=Aphidius gifuensis TaxID=684658 RepID=UPI001CDCFF23|nr:pyridoxal phosphate phosphatase PHOSPHO2-like isoform X2 [Aphidius gifuensis]